MAKSSKALQVVSSEDTQKRILAFMAELQPYALKGEYRQALAIARSALKEYPDDFLCRYQYAKLLGDWADELPPARRKKFKKEAAGILLPLTHALNGQSVKVRFGVCLNYYYQTGKFREMVRWGRRFARQDSKLGHYAEALGACLAAEEALKASREARARLWAERSIHAWESYGLKGESYYFAHYTFAKALAIKGESKRARASLKVAARLSGRPLTDWEFADVVRMIG